MKHLKRQIAASIFGFGLVAAAASAQAETYSFEKTHAEIRFTYTHMGLSNQSGEFTSFNGELDFNKDTPEKSTLMVNIDTDSVATLVPSFDDHLKSKDFFNVSQFPKATFKSTAIEVTGKNSGIITGDLTIMGKTKSVKLDTKMNFEGIHPASNFNPKFKDAKALGFSATGQIKRSDFGLGKYAPAVSDDVTLTIEVEMVNK